MEDQYSLTEKGRQRAKSRHRFKTGLFGRLGRKARILEVMSKGTPGKTPERIYYDNPYASPTSAYADNRSDVIETLKALMEEGLVTRDDPRIFKRTPLDGEEQGKISRGSTRVSRSSSLRITPKMPRLRR